MVNLEKGGKILLEKANESGTALTKVRLGLGWDAKASAAAGAEFDLDASVVCVNAEGKSIPGSFVYYNNLKAFGGAVQHTGDNLTGEGDGDDESIILDLANIPTEVQKLVVVVNIYKADNRSQNFGMVENSFARLVNEANSEEMIHFDLNFDASTATGVKFATIFRKGDAWAFSADQTEFAGGLESITSEYSVSA